MEQTINGKVLQYTLKKVEGESWMEVYSLYLGSHNLGNIHLLSSDKGWAALVAKPKSGTESLVRGFISKDTAATYIRQVTDFCKIREEDVNGN